MQTLMIFWSSWRPKTIVSERQHRLDLVLMHWYRTEPSPSTKESLRHRFFYPVLETKTFSLGFGVSVGNRCLRPLSPGVEGPFSTSVMQSTSNRHYSKYNYTRCFLDAIIRSTSLAYCDSIWIIFGWCFLFVPLFPMNKCGKMMKCSVI